MGKQIAVGEAGLKAEKELRETVGFGRGAFSEHHEARCFSDLEFEQIKQDM